MRWLVLAWALVCAGQDFPFSDSQSLLWRAETLEEEGRITEAWLLYQQVAMLEPGNRLAAGKTAQLRTKALERATISSNKPLPTEVDPAFVMTEADRLDVERLAPPPALEPKPVRLTLNFRGDAKELYTKLLAHFGLEVLFDGDYDNPQDRQVRLEEATFHEAVYSANLVTGSFVNPISPRIGMVVRDTEQKRREQERTVAITLPVPTAISSPEAQELGRAVQQIFELQRVSIDTVRGSLMIRDRWSKVKYAELLLSQLLRLRGQVLLDVELMEVNEQSNLGFGFALPTSSQLIPLVRRPFLSPAVVNGFRGALTFGGGATLFGLGVTGAELFASMTYSRTQSLYSAQVRALDGLAATVHIGDRYPIITQTTGFAAVEGASSIALAPNVQFEDLGLTLKMTPHLHANGETSIEVESEFKVLTGQTNNDIPVIATRKYTGTVRLKAGEWAVASGLITINESVNRAGLAGIANLPVIGAALSRNGRDRRIGQTLLVIRPRVIAASPAELETRPLFTGPETKFLPVVN